mmetsp:Transcript_4347/g.9925  ORF Transcript_4347/g.9925 Transcript_4347/m.9925 type:complete len:249 (-) Transcript_4347:6-752(-)
MMSWALRAEIPSPFTMPARPKAPPLRSPYDSPISIISISSLTTAETASASPSMPMRGVRQVAAALCTLSEGVASVRSSLCTTDETLGSPLGRNLESVAMKITTPSFKRSPCHVPLSALLSWFSNMGVSSSMQLCPCSSMSRSPACVICPLTPSSGSVRPWSLSLHRVGKRTIISRLVSDSATLESASATPLRVKVPPSPLASRYIVLSIDTVSWTAPALLFRSSASESAAIFLTPSKGWLSRSVSWSL